VTAIDWLAIALVTLLAVAGAARGLLTGVLSIAGILGGAVLGAKLAPIFLPQGSDSPYLPVAALAGAILLAAFLEGLGSIAGSALRSRLRLTPLRTLDSFGGLALGAATAIAIVWVLGAVALQVPGQTNLRRAAQRSVILRQLNGVVSPRRLLNALARVDPFPEITGPLAQVPPPDRSVLREPGVRRAAGSVVRIVGTACGLGVEGSGWIARPNLVVTAAHVVAGQQTPTVEAPGGATVEALPVAYDAHNDVAVLEVPSGSLGAAPLPFVDPQEGARAAIVGYPENHGLTAAPGRIGQTARFLSRDAYGHGPVLRLVTTVRGRIRPGDSGGPAIDDLGRVQATVFAARVGSDSGYAVPTQVVRDELRKVAGRPVSTGPCAR
jgi:S1-C subfamily serine protease